MSPLRLVEGSRLVPVHTQCTSQHDLHIRSLHHQYFVLKINLKIIIIIIIKRLAREHNVNQLYILFVNRRCASYS
jgi:hypothetical protein